jgi:hypothetical protein
MMKNVSESREPVKSVFTAEEIGDQSSKHQTAIAELQKALRSLRKCVNVYHAIKTLEAELNRNLKALHELKQSKYIVY